MEVILQEDIAHLGHIGEIVKVRDGYARNYLFPRALAVQANKRNVREREHQQRVVEEKRRRVAATAQEVANKMAAVALTFTARAGEAGKLFGSITNQDIERELRDNGFEVDRRRIRLDEPIKSVGEHKVTVILAAGVPCEITISVVAIEESKSGEAGEAGGVQEEPRREAGTAEQPAADLAGADPVEGTAGVPEADSTDAAG